MKRTLADELRRTLIANSLEAPEPAASIQAILERTVGPELPEAASRPTDGVAGRRRLHWTGGRTLAVAASVAIALITVAIVNTGRNSTRQSSSAGSAAGPAGASLGRGAAAPAAGAATDLQANSAPKVAAGSAAAGSAAAAGAGPGSCPVADSSSVTSLSLPGGVAGHRASVVTTRCWQAGGSQAPSSVAVYDSAAVLPPVVLISPSENLHVVDVSLRAGPSSAGPDVVVRAAWWNDGKAPWQGALYEYSFRPSADGSSFVPLPPRLDALSCTARDVSLTAAPQGTGRFALRITNTSKASCVVEGYPQVASVAPGGDMARGSLGPKVAATASGERAVPVLLSPRDSATAAVDEAPGCAPDRLSVSLPAVGPVGVTPAPGVCARVKVQPFAPSG